MPSYVIVGASRGLGYQWLLTLSANPSNTVVGLVRTPDNTIKSLSSLSPSHPNIHIIQGDLTDPASLAAASKRTAEITGGVVDYLFVNGAYLNYNTAFIQPTEYTGKDDFFLAELTKSMNTNVAGVLSAINAFLPLVKKSSIKKVVVISSGHGDLDFIHTSGVSEAVPYAISKAAVNILVAKYAAELKDEGVIFLAMSPGVVDTNDTSDVPQDQLMNFVQKVLKYAPDFKGPITPEQSVDMQLKVIHGITLKDSGAFWSHLGGPRML